MNADSMDDGLVQVFEEQDDYVQILGVDPDGGSEDVEVASLDLDGGESVFIDIDSDFGDDDAAADIPDILSD